MKAKPSQRKRSGIARVRAGSAPTGYAAWSGGIASLLDESRRQAARSVNAILTATYWEIGRRIVEFVQAGETRAGYGDVVIEKLSHDLAKKFGRGFSHRNLEQMRLFYLQHPGQEISQTLSAKFNRQGLAAIFQTVSEKFFLTANCLTVSGESSGQEIPQTVSAELEFCQTPSDNSLVPISATLSRKYETPSRISSIDLALYLDALAQAFPLSWSHYVRLLSVESPEARKFYETESLRGGWSVRQLDRQVSTLFYERTALSKNKAKLLTAGARSRPEDAVSVEEEIKSSYVLEFLNLRNKVLAAQYKLALPEARLLEAEIEKTRRLLESPARRMHAARRPRGAKEI